MHSHYIHNFKDSDEEVGARNKAAGSSFIPGLSNPQEQNF